MRLLAKFMAMAGGFVLIALIAITVFSIIGRSLNSIGHHDPFEAALGPIAQFFQMFGPINGDFELVEAGVAFAIMAFIPWCQLNRAHAKVELFTSFLPSGGNRFLSFIWEALFAFVMVVIAWRLYIGTTDKMRFNETTFMLQFPVWWGYAACCAAAVIAAIVAVYSAFTYGRELFARDDQIQGVQSE